MCEGPFTPSVSTSVALRASTDVDARVRPSTRVDGRRREVDAHLCRNGTHGKRPARHTPSASTSVDGRKRAQNQAGSILSASTSIDGRTRAWCERAGLFPCVPYRRRRASTSVDGRRHARCEWVLTLCWLISVLCVVFRPIVWQNIFYSSLWSQYWISLLLDLFTGYSKQ